MGREGGSGGLPEGWLEFRAPGVDEVLPALPAPVTIELESPALSGLLGGAPAPVARTRERERAASTWRRSAGEWKGLVPPGLYARRLRTTLLLVATLPLVPLALLLALPIACANLWIHGSLRRVFFTQLRVGWRGQIFLLYKFRTMLDVPGDDSARVTRFGRFLRNTHLDELPQLWNVLRGDMCLIGPRPEMISTERWAARHVPGFSERLCLRPGLTGFAQITHGYTDDGDLFAYREKLRLNRRYREELSLGLDAVILTRTVLWMLRGRGWR
jgi:lipopolysaccharide/colanic/teichoic acid biosynthesis glycosyltransferase